MISTILGKVLQEYPNCRENQVFAGNPIGTLIRNLLVEELRGTGLLKGNHIVKGSVGQGTWATVPWIAVMDSNITTTTQKGVYIVYLFANDGSALYLTLNQGCTDIIQRNGRTDAYLKMVDNAVKIRKIVQTPEGFTAGNNIFIGNPFYESGCIFYKEYKSEHIPPDNSLIMDLRLLLEAYSKYCDTVTTNSIINPATVQYIEKYKIEYEDINHILITDLYDRSKSLSSYKMKQEVHSVAQLIKRTSDQFNGIAYSDCLLEIMLKTLKSIEKGSEIYSNSAAHNMACTVYLCYKEDQLSFQQNAARISRILEKEPQIMIKLINIVNNAEDNIVYTTNYKEVIAFLKFYKGIKEKSSAGESQNGTTASASKIDIHEKQETVNKISWDIDEVFLLVDLYDKSKHLSLVVQKQKIIELSRCLRDRAIAKGYAIDNVFRNETGIQMKLKNIEYLETNGLKGLSSHSNNDLKVFEISKTNPSAFRERVNEIMQSPQINKKPKSIIENGFPKSKSVESAIQPVIMPTVYLQAQTTERISEKTHQESQEINIEPNVRSEQDKRLFAKYPIVYKKIFSTLQELSKDNPSGETLGVLRDCISYFTRCTDIEDILDNASWSRANGSKYIFSDDMITHEKVKDAQVETYINEPKNSILTVDFQNIVDLQYTRPVKLVYFKYKNAEIVSWTDLYVNIMQLLYMDYPDCIPIGKSFNFEGRIDFGGKEISKIMFAPKKIYMEMYVETNLSETDIVKNINALLNLCSIDKKNIVIKYQRELESQQRAITSVIEPTPKLPNENYEKVLIERFRKGFRLNSPIEMRNFKKHYEVITGEVLEVDDKEIERIIRCHCVLYEEKAFVPKTMLSEELKERLFSYIYDRFGEGKTTLYYQIIFKEFSEELLDSLIYNTDILKAYLIYINDGTFYTNKNHLSKYANAISYPLEEICALLQEDASPMGYKDIFADLSHIPQPKIRQILAANAEFISNGHGEYFHIDAVHFSDEELDSIATIIRDVIEQKGFLSGNELVDAIKKKYYYIIEKNAAFSGVGLRDAIKYHLGDKFSFKGNIISRAGHELSMWDVFTDYSRSRYSFSLDELNVLASELGTTIYFDAVYNNSLRVNKDQFVSKERAEFHVNETDAVLDRCCAGNYIAIGKVREFGFFPDAGFPWNNFLLEHYVAAYSEKYCLVHIGFNGTICVGAIVKRSAGIESFDEFIVDAIANSNVQLKKESALHYLFDEGYIARRNYNNIEELLIKATALRNREEPN